MHSPVPAEADLFLTQVTTLFAPVPQRTSLDTYTVLRDYLVLTELDTVKTRLRFWRYAKDDGKCPLLRLVDSLIAWFCPTFEKALVQVY